MNQLVKTDITSRSGGLQIVHLAWAAMFCSILIWGFGEVRAGTIGNTGNWYRMILVVGAALLGTHSLFNNGARIWQAINWPISLLFVYATVAIISSIFVPDYAFYSMWKGLEVLVDVIIAMAILSSAKPHESGWTCYRIYIWLSIALLAIWWIEAAVIPSEVFLPSRGIIPYTMHGHLPAYNDNTLAFQSALLSIVFIARYHRAKGAGTKAVFLAAIAWALLTLILAQSRTSLLGFLVALSVYLVFNRKFIFFALIIMIALIGFLFAGFSQIAVDYVVRGQSAELFSSLSGRTIGWNAAWELFKESPLFGHGFAAAARTQILGTGGASTLHGALFDVLVGVGLMGLFPWLGAITILSWRLYFGAGRIALRSNTIQRSRHAEMLAVLVLVLIRSLTSSGLAMHDHTFMLFLAVLLYAYSLNSMPSEASIVGSKNKEIKNTDRIIRNRPKVIAYAKSTRE